MKVNFKKKIELTLSLCSMISFRDNNTTHVSRNFYITIKKFILDIIKKKVVVYKCHWLIYGGTRYKTKGYIDAIEIAAKKSEAKSLILDNDGSFYFGGKLRLALLGDVLQNIGYFFLVSLLWLFRYNKENVFYTNFVESFFLIKEACRIIKESECCVLHSIVPLRNESLALSVCYKFVCKGKENILYDWGVSQEKFPEDLKNQFLMIKSSRYNLNKTYKAIEFGNPVPVWNKEKNNDFSSPSIINKVVILDWGISKIIGEAEYIKDLRIVSDIIKSIEDNFGKKMIVKIKLRNDSLSKEKLKFYFGEDLEVIDTGVSFQEVFNDFDSIALHNNSTSQYELVANKVPQVNIANFLYSHLEVKPKNPYFKGDIGFCPLSLSCILSIDSLSLIDKSLSNDSGIEFSFVSCGQKLFYFLNEGCRLRL